jgi:hypothetical protein
MDPFNGKLYFFFSIIFMYNIILLKSSEMINDHGRNILYDIQYRQQKFDSDKDLLNSLVQSSTVKVINMEIISDDAGTFCLKISLYKITQIVIIMKYSRKQLFVVDIESDNMVTHTNLLFKNLLFYRV